LTQRLMEAVVEVGGGDDLGRLRAALISFVEVTADSPALVRVINQEGVSQSPRLAYIYEQHIGRAMKVVNGILDRLAVEGRVRPVPGAVFYFLMANGATGPLTLPALASCFPDSPAHKRKSDLRRYAVSVVDLLVDGLVIG